MGINGAKGNVIGRWDSQTLRKQMQWRKPKLIILAYGTNEAFDLKFEPIEFAQTLRDNIRSLRFFSTRRGHFNYWRARQCKNSPQSPHQLPTRSSQRITQRRQRAKRVAQEEKTLYWDWAGFMGGICAAPHWAQLSPPLMGKDLIHLSKEGYEASADDLFGALQAKIRL